MHTATVLIVDDDNLIRATLRRVLTAAGYEVFEADSAEAARAHFSEDLDLALLDFHLPDGTGVDVMRDLHERRPEAVALMLTANSQVRTAVDAMRAGAYHYLTKPFDIDEVLLQIERALETTALRREVRRLRDNASSPYAFDRVIGASDAMRTAVQKLEKVARAPSSTVLLTGESGVGKDLAAKVIHYNSTRATKPFLNVTCSALPENLLESELFGYERGAFTDARQQKRGLFELANGGTVFLDEIGEMSPVLQAKLLRVLEEKCFRRVGGTGDIRVDVRIVAATNRNLERAVKEEKFREDLFYRLNVLRVALPPLRDRAGDVPLLAAFYVDQFNREFGKHVTSIAPAAMRALEAHSWPGNVRELRNVLERAMLLADGDTLTPTDLFERGVSDKGGAESDIPLPTAGVNLEALERSFVVQALQRTKGNKTRAAALLGLNRDQIRYRLEKFGLDAVAPGES